jgi:hypothetical protein
VALRIGFDLDGVLADMDSALTHHAEVLFGPAPVGRAPARVEAAAPVADDAPGAAPDKIPLPTRRPLSVRQQRLLWRRVRGIDGFWESLDETAAGVVSRLAALASRRRWEILFLTRRPATLGATAQIQSQRWLIAKGFDLPSVYVVTTSRGMIAAALALDVVVDDTTANCVDVACDSKARTIAVFRDPHASPPAVLSTMGIDVVRSTDEGLTRLTEIDAAVNKRPSAMERLVRKLGLTR